MLDAKISTISLSASNTILIRHLLDDCSNGIVEVSKSHEQLEHIQEKFYELGSPNIHNLVVYFKRCSKGGYIDNILELKFKSRYDYI